jgi:non-ribosomal peptide synthetase component F
VTNNKNLAFANTLGGGVCQMINIDEIDSSEMGDNPGLALSPDSLAYILYTSGSTGQPKGIQQNHRNVLHFIRAYTNTLRISGEDRLTIFSSYSHDAAIVDIFAALLNGATLYPLSIKKKGIASLAEWIIKEEITIYHSIPTVYRHFVDTLTGEEQFSRLRFIVLGGEAVFKKDAEALSKIFLSKLYLCQFVRIYRVNDKPIKLGK